MSYSTVTITKVKKTSRVKRLKKFIFRRRVVALIITSFLILIPTFLIYRNYITFKCENFDYAVNYYLTKGKEDDKLLRVNYYNIIFHDIDKIVIKASGLRKLSPHKTLKIEGHFIKNENNSWELENIYLSEN